MTLAEYVKLMEGRAAAKRMHPELVAEYVDRSARIPLVPKKPPRRKKRATPEEARAFFSYKPGDD